MAKLTRKQAEIAKWFSVNSLAEFIAEYTKDGAIDRDVWQWYKWFRRKCLKGLK